MADYSHHHTYRVARGPHGARARRLGVILAGAALLMVAALAWVWTQQRTVDSPLPRTTAAASSSVAPPPKPAQTAVQAPPTPEAAAPPSAAVAAAGDTRPVR